MIKRIMAMILCLVILLSMSAPAISATDEIGADVPPAMGEMPGQNAPNGADDPPQDEEAQRGDRPTEGDRPAMPEGEMPAVQDVENVQPETAQPAQPSDSNSTQAENPQQTQSLDDDMERNGSADDVNGEFGNMQRDDRNDMRNDEQKNEEASVIMNEAQSGSGVFGFLQTYGTLLVSIVMLAAAFVFVKFYKRKFY